jgi:hypothetical protein
MTEASLASPIVRVRVGLGRVKVWEWLVAALSVAMFVGAHLDAWAHVHVRSALETILTPSHFVVYGSFVALAVALAAPPVARLARGRPLRTAYARSYAWPLVGGAVFVLAGGLDLVWHLLFGVEVSVEALLSPTHLGLAIGAGLLWSGPLITAWRRRSADVSLLRLLPALLSTSAIVGLIAFTTHFAHPFVDPWPAYPYSERDPSSWFIPSLGFASLIIQTAVLMGGALLLLRRWPKPPVGSFTVMFTFSSVGLPFLHDQAELILVPVLTGLFADFLALTLARTGGRRSVRLFAAFVPMAMGTAYLLVLDATSRVAWGVHLLAGAIVICAAVGSLVSLLVFPPGRAGALHEAS